MDDMGRFSMDFALFSAQERAVLLEALRAGQVKPDCLVRLAQARRRTCRRAESDAKTDAARRVLVGARIPRALYAKVKKRANKRGVSVYRLMVDMIEQMCDNEEEKGVERERLLD